MAKHKKAEQAQPDAEHVAQKLSRKDYDSWSACTSSW